MSDKMKTGPGTHPDRQTKTAEPTRRSLFGMSSSASKGELTVPHKTERAVQTVLDKPHTRREAMETGRNAVAAARMVDTAHKLDKPKNVRIKPKDYTYHWSDEGDAEINRYSSKGLLSEGYQKVNRAVNHTEYRHPLSNSLALITKAGSKKEAHEKFLAHPEYKKRQGDRNYNKEPEIDPIEYRKLQEALVDKHERLNK